MARPSDSKELALFLKPPLLSTKSAEDFASLIAALARGYQTPRHCRANVCCRHCRSFLGDLALAPLQSGHRQYRLQRRAVIILSQSSDRRARPGTERMG